MASTLNVKSLRLRLGWTQSDLSRRLGCKTTEVSRWEMGLGIPNAEQSGTLELLSGQAESCALETQSSPRAEIFCERKHIGQISISEDFDKN